MQLTALFGAIVALVGSVVAQTSDPGITSPSLTACQPASFTASGTSPPFLIAVIPAGQTAAAAIEFLPNVNAAGAFTWNVNLAPGSNITVRITDSRGVVGYSSPLVIQAGQTTSCVGASASFTQAAGSSATGATISGQTTTSSTSELRSTSMTGAPPTSVINSATSTAAGGSSAAAQTTSSRSAASGTYVAGSAFALVGAAVLALMA